MSSAYLYIRVSTDDQADKGYSQRHQDEVLHKYCALKSISVKRVIYEDHSAKTFDRPAWKEMLKRLKAIGKGKPEAGLVLFTKWDRFSRSAADAYQMISVLRGLGIEPQAIEQPLDLEIPENKIMLAFYLAAPEVENERRGLNIFFGIRRARKEGRWMGHAPVGYLNKCTESGHKYICPDGQQSELMKRAFGQLASGKYAIQQVWKQMIALGLKSQSNNFHQAIRNPVYCGMIVVPAFKDEPEHRVRGQHQSLISIELFEKVQRVLDGKKAVKGTKTESSGELPLRGFLACSRCSRMLTGSASRGRSGYYHYYHCCNKCGLRLRASRVNEAFMELLGRLKARRPMRDLFEEILKDVYRQQNAGTSKRRQQIQRQLAELEQRQHKIRELVISETFETVDYQSARQDTARRIDAITVELQQLPDPEERLNRLLSQQRSKFLDLQRLFDTNSADQRRLIAALFPGRLEYSDTGFDSGQLAATVPLIFRLPTGSTDG